MVQPTRLRLGFEFRRICSLDHAGGDLVEALIHTAHYRFKSERLWPQWGHVSLLVGLQLQQVVNPLGQQQNRVCCPFQRRVTPRALSLVFAGVVDQQDERVCPLAQPRRRRGRPITPGAGRRGSRICAV